MVYTRRCLGVGLLCWCCAVTDVQTCLEHVSITMAGLVLLTRCGPILHTSLQRSRSHCTRRALHGSTRGRVNLASLIKQSKALLKNKNVATHAVPER